MEPRRLLATFAVNNTADAGPGSLRQALIDANAAPGLDLIGFAIPGSAPQTISPTSPLPDITDPVVIDGYTQPGARPNTLAVGDDAILKIVLAGGLTLRAGDSTVRGLVLGTVDLENGGGNVIEGNFIGTDPTGAFALNPGGVLVSSSFNTIGGLSPGARNLISGNAVGIAIGSGVGGPVSNNLVQGNFIGTDVTGTRALGNFRGVQLGPGTSGNTIGGTAAGARNLISGNSERGIFVTSILFHTGLPRNNSVQGNFIGTDVTGTRDLGNGGAGVDLEDATDNTVGGLDIGAGNTIAFNRGGGVRVQNLAVTTTQGNAILSNSLFANTGPGIDLVQGANNNQNAPVLTSATATPGGTLSIRGSFSGAAGTAYTIQFFANPAPTPPGTAQGRALLASETVTTDAAGNAALNIALPTSVPVGQVITATATDPGNNTSEFSPGVPVFMRITDLAVSLTGAPAPATVGDLLTYAISVTNHGPDVATGVTLTDTLPLLASASPSQGTLSQSGGTVTADLGTLAPGATATVTIAVRPVAAGLISNAVTVTDNEHDPDLGNNTAILMTTVTASVAVPPRVVALQRLGFHLRRTRLALTFSAPMDASRVQDTTNYRLVAPGRDRRFGTRDDRRIPISSAACDAARQTVILAPRPRLPLRGTFQLTVVGTPPRGLTDTSGTFLDGAGTGMSGTDFVATFGREILVTPSRRQAIR